MRPLICALVALAADDRRLVLGRDHAITLAQVGELHRLELAAHLFGDDLSAGQDGNVLQHGLAPVAKARRLDGDAVEHAAQLVQHQGGQRFAVDVLGR